MKLRILVVDRPSTTCKGRVTRVVSETHAFFIHSGSFGSWKDCGVLCQVTHAMTNNLETDTQSTKKELLKALTKPLTKLVIQVRQTIIVMG